MKVDIIPLAREHYEKVFELIKIAEPFKGFQYYDQLCQELGSRIGFTYWVDGTLIGSITYSDYYPGINVIIHAAFHPEYREAMNRKVIRHTFDFVFNKLLVCRVTSYVISGVTDEVIGFLERLGFVYEGCIREAVELPQGVFDLIMYGMLRKECRWI